MRIFRKALRQEIEDSLDIRTGRCSPEAERYRRIACTIFAGNSRRRRLVQSVLHILPNGDWTDHSSVQIYVPDPAVINRKALAQLLARGLRATLAHSQFLVFNRKRWTQNDDAICRLGLMQVCHGLLGRTFRRWLVLVGRTTAAQDSDSGHRLREASVPAVGGQQQPAPLPLRDADGGRGDTQQPEDPAEEQLVDSGGDVTTAAAKAGGGQVDWAKVNQQNRTLVASWVAKDPLLDLIVVRLVMEPSAAYLRRQLYLGSERWELEQLRQGLGMGEDGGAARAYRLAVTAQGESERTFYEHQRAVLQNPNVWTLLIPANRTERTRCLIFRMVSRIGAEFERLIGHPHNRAPFSLFWR